MCNKKKERDLSLSAKNVIERKDLKQERDLRNF